MQRFASHIAACLLGGVFGAAAMAPPAVAAPLWPGFLPFHRHRDNRFAAWNDGDRALLNRVENRARAAVAAYRGSSDPNDADYGVYFAQHPDDERAGDFRRAFGGGVEMSNNCYSFAVGSPGGHAAFDWPAPGAAAGIFFDFSRVTDGAYIRRMAKEDGVRPLAEGAPAPAGFRRIALFIAPGREFHWYREAPDGVWFHKRGHMAVTDRDAAGHVIHDPRRADRDYRKAGGANYTQFEGFFIVPEGGIDLHTPASRNQHPEGEKLGLEGLDKLLTAPQTVWRLPAP